jgi:hypothetical protein
MSPAGLKVESWFRLRLAGSFTLDSKVLRFPPGRSLFGALIAIGLVAISACGSSSGQTGVTSPAPGETQTGESKPVTYTDTRFHYRIDAPGGQMTPNADGTASFVGPSERLEVAIIEGSRAGNPGSQANNDLSILSQSAPGFKKLSDPTAVTLSGRTVTRFSYTWNAGISVVTGKQLELTTVRYYVPKDSKTLAVIAYGIASNQFDPQGADDLVLTFQWL